MFNRFPKRTGIYHVRDNINQLEFELYFRQVNSLLKLPKYDYGRKLNTEKQNQQQNALDTDKKLGEVLQLNIKWQQKILNENEKQLFKDFTNCNTEQQKKYHQWLQNEKDETEHNAAIERGKSKCKRRRSRKSKEQNNKLITTMDKNMEYEIYTYVQEDNFQAEEEGPTQRKANGSSVEVMYVYATLKSQNQQLLKLKWQPEEHLLLIYPDFNRFEDNPYFIEIDTDYKHFYAYALENISKVRAREQPQSAINCLALGKLSELSANQWPPLNLEELQTLFAMPPKRMRRVCLLFELREAQHFEYDNLHVRYHILLPPHVVLEEGLLNASTHSSTKNSSTANIFHFGFNWQLTLLCEECFNPAQLLHIYFELISIDSWERERIEGYAHYTTHLVPGNDSLQLQCLLPVDGFWEALHCYFVGGRKKFDFERFFTASGETQFQSRYQYRMRTTGTLHFSCQRFAQQHGELLQPLRRNCAMTLDDIMLAYREARRRLEAIVLK